MMMRRLTCLVSTTLLAVCSASTLVAQAAEVGDRIRVIQQQDTLTGRLVSLKGDTLVLREEGGLLREILLDTEVEAFHQDRRPVRWVALALGFGIGGGIGYQVAGTHRGTVCSSSFGRAEACREEDVKDGGPIGIGMGIGLLTAFALTFPSTTWTPIGAHALDIVVGPTLDGALGFSVTLPTSFGGAR